MLKIDNMERHEIRDVLVDTSDHCFICLDEVSPEMPPSRDNIKAEPMSESLPPLKYSLQHLSRYLEMVTICKVLNDKCPVPSMLLANDERSNVQVVLCGTCGRWNETISELCSELEKIQMDINSYLELIYERLQLTDTNGKKGEVFGKTETSDSIGAAGSIMCKPDVARSLRLELKQKCSRKLRTTSPRVNIQKLTSKQFLKAKRNKLNSKCNSEIPTTSQMASSPPEGSCEQWTNSYKDVIFTPVKMKHGDNNDNDPLDMSDDDDDTREESQLNDLIWKEISTPPISTEDPLLLGVSVSVSQASHSPEASSIQIQQPSSSSNQCSICQKTFANPKNCERHILEIHRGVQTSCQFCSKLFRSTSSLYYHQRTSCGLPADQRPRTFRCQTCGKGYADEKVLRFHMRQVHLKVLESKCVECGGTFSSPYNLKMHYKTVHLQVRDHGCTLCGMKFKRKDALQNHRRAKHKRID